MEIPRLETEDDPPRQERISTNSSLQGSSGITKMSQDPQSRMESFLTLPKPIHALDTSFVLHNKMTIHMDTHAFLITQKKEALDF
jgi:hypothetical protein